MSTLQAAVTVLPDQSPVGDAGDTLATATVLNLPANTSTAIASRSATGRTGVLDVDLYRFTGKAGDLITVSGQNAAPYPYERLFDATGTQVASGVWYNTPNISLWDVRLPVDGTYYLGISGAYNESYDPGTSGERDGLVHGELPSHGGASERVADVSVGDLAVAATGTAAQAVGGVGGRGSDDHAVGHGAGVGGDGGVHDGGRRGEHRSDDGERGVGGERRQEPDGGGAARGGERHGAAGAGGRGLFLQVVPMVSGVSSYGTGYAYHNTYEHLTGSGFAEAGTTVNWGSVSLPDRTSSPYPLDVYSGGTQLNVNAGVPPGAAYGPITVTTLGGTSAAWGCG